MATIEEGYYFISIPGTNKVLDVRGDGQHNGVSIIAYEKHGGDNQKWRIEKCNDNFYKITGVSSGKVMESERTEQTDSEAPPKVEICDYYGNRNQIWNIEKEENQYTFKNKDGLYLYIDDNNKVVGDSIINTKFKLDRMVRFCVTSDLHIEKDKSKEDDWVKMMIAFDRLTPEFFAICGDLTDTNYSKEVESVYHQINILEKVYNSTLICEGHGNHDGDRIKYPWDEQARNIVTNRNNIRALRKPQWKWLFDTNKNYHNHYTWCIELINNVRIHFFMLNNVPGYGKIDKDKKEGDNARERDAYDSLSFLKTQLCNLKENDYYILFFHINFNVGERWWTEKSKEDLQKVIEDKKFQAKYITSFFGHTHSTKDTYGKSVEERLLKTPYYGYRCKCSGGNGARYFNIVDLSIENNKKEGNVLECKITPKNVNTDEFPNNSLYLLNHNGITSEGGAYSSVTLRFQLSTGKELNRIATK